MQLKFYFIYLTVFVNVMAFTLVFPLLPLYAKAFNTTSFQIGLLAASFGLAQLFFSPLWGMISDRIGRKPTILIGVAGLALGFLMFGFANSLQSLFIARFLQGIFSGAALPSARAYVADLTNKNERVKAMGRVGAAMALGVIVGPFIGTVLAETSLSFPFFVSAGVAASQQAAGLITSENSYVFAFLGTVFGIAHAHGGVSENQELTITTPAPGSESATITVNGVTIAATTDSGAATFHVTESWLHYIDATHANIIAMNDGAINRTLSAANVAGFDFTIAQDIDLDQDQISDNHIIVYFFAADIFPKGV